MSGLQNGMMDKKKKRRSVEMEKKQEDNEM